MSKRISKNTLIAVVIAIVGLFAATQVIAQVIGVPCSNFNVVLDSVSANTDGSHTYTYNIEGGSVSLNKLSKVEFGIAAPLEVKKTPKVEPHPPGEGGIGSFKYAANLPLVKVVTVTPQPGTGIIPVSFDVFATSGKIGLIGIHTDAGNKQETCVADGPVPFGLDPEPQEFIYIREAEGVTCKMAVQLEPFFAITATYIGDSPQPAGACEVSEVFDISELGINSNSNTAIELQEGWFAFTGSPAEYCYYNKKKRKYICVTY
jgi:hypothetical protein